MADALSQAEAYLDSVGFLDASGKVLYSGISTLQPGPVYLLGLNPGGSEGASLRDSIAGSRCGHNAYLDEQWAPAGRLRREGESLLQTRVQHLCALMGRETCEVPASNLVFTRSRSLHTHPDFARAIRLCLPVHEMFVERIDPKFLMTFGALGTFAQAFTIDQLEERSAEHGSWRAYRGIATIACRQLAFGNIPHMSLWASDKREDVVRWAVQALIT